MDKPDTKNQALGALTGNGKALVVTLLFRLLFGGYVMGMDQYRFNDLESALTVLVIYVLMAVFVSLFLLGKRYGLIGIIGLESVFLVFNSVFLFLALGQIADAGMHDPLDNWWATLLRYMFSILTLVFAIKANKQTKQGINA
ncbi:MAG: hypothetical protein WC325_00160 [Candidatus Bathyarchaeia archaeon]